MRTNNPIFQWHRAIFLYKTVTLFIEHSVASVRYFLFIIIIIIIIIIK